MIFFVHDLYDHNNTYVEGSDRNGANRNNRCCHKYTVQGRAGRRFDTDSIVKCCVVKQNICCIPGNYNLVIMCILIGILFESIRKRKRDVRKSRCYLSAVGCNRIWETLKQFREEETSQHLNLTEGQSIIVNNHTPCCGFGVCPACTD